MTGPSEEETTSESPSHRDRATSTHRRNAHRGGATPSPEGIGSHADALRENAPHRDEKLLKKMANTRARQPDETLVACVEEARKDALEVAQEADAPPQARAEDASTLTPLGSFPTVRIRGSRFIFPRDDGPSSWRTRRSWDGMRA